MNIEKLEVGMIVKNYKAMCELLGEKVKGGDSKKAQIKEWERFFSYKKDGNKFVIIQIYKEPMDKITNISGNNNIYGKITQLLMLDMLMKSESKNITISKSRLIESLGIANQNYSDCKESLVKLSNYLNIGIEHVYDFYNINDSNFTSIINTALKNLRDKRLIMYNTVYKCVELENGKSRIMTKEEMYQTQLIEKSVLEELGYNSVSDVRRSSSWREFKRCVSLILKEEMLISYYYQAYDMSINVNYLENEKDELLSQISNDFNRNNKKIELNNLVCDNILKNAEKRSMEENKSKPFRNNEKYIDNTNALSNSLVKLNVGSIIESVRKEKSTYSKPKSEKEIKLESLMNDLDECLPF